MPAVQVIKNSDGTKGVAPMELGGFGGGSGTVDTVARTAAAAAQATADAALPKSGGEMTGDLSLGYADDQTIRMVSIKSDETKNFVQLIATQSGGTVSRGIFRVYDQHNEAHTFSEIGLNINPDGTAYATCPPPRQNNYASDIVNTKAMKDYAPYVIPGGATLHIDAVNGSDTADLFMGRGFSQEKPFKTLNALFMWLSRCSSQSIVSVVLHSDIQYPPTNQVYREPMIFAVQLQSDDVRRTINIMNEGGLVIQGGVLRFANINLQASGIGHFISVDGQTGYAKCFIGNDVSMDGEVTVAALSVTRGGECYIHAPVTGNVTGKKYICTNGGMIIGASSIPGSEAGTCDANSKAFG